VLLLLLLLVALQLLLFLAQHHRRLDHLFGLPKLVPLLHDQQLLLAHRLLHGRWRRRRNETRPLSQLARRGEPGGHTAERVALLLLPEAKVHLLLEGQSGGLQKAARPLHQLGRGLPLQLEELLAGAVLLLVQLVQLVQLVRAARLVLHCCTMLLLLLVLARVHLQLVHLHYFLLLLHRLQTGARRGAR